MPDAGTTRLPETRVNGAPLTLWRAIDANGNVLDSRVQKRRNAKVDSRFLACKVTTVKRVTCPYHPASAGCCKERDRQRFWRHPGLHRQRVLHTLPCDSDSTDSQQNKYLSPLWGTRYHRGSHSRHVWRQHLWDRIEI